MNLSVFLWLILAADPQPNHEDRTTTRELVMLDHLIFEEHTELEKRNAEYVRALECRCDRIQWIRYMTNTLTAQGGGGIPGWLTEDGSSDVPFWSDDFLIRTLGERRAECAIPVLIEKIDQPRQLRNEYWSGAGWRPWSVFSRFYKPSDPEFPNHYPAYRALVSIGMPSCWAALEELPHETNAKRRRLFAELLFAVVKKPASLAILENLRTKLDSDIKRERVDEAISYLQAKS